MLTAVISERNNENYSYPTKIKPTEKELFELYILKKEQRIMGLPTLVRNKKCSPTFEIEKSSELN